MRTKLLIYFILLICCPVAIFSQNNAKHSIDSLHKIIESTAPGDSIHLSALYRLTYLHQSMPKGIRYALDLLDKAQKVNSNKYICQGAYHAAIYYQNYGVIDSTRYYVELLTPLAEKEQDWDTYFGAKRLTINTYLFEMKFELAIHEALTAAKKAREKNNLKGMIMINIPLSTAYINSQQIEEGVNVLKEVYQFIRKPDKTLNTHNLLCALIPACWYAQKVDEMLNYIHELEEAMDYSIKNHIILKESLVNVFILIDIFYAHYYIHKEQYSKAYHYLHKLNDSIEKGNYLSYRYLYLDLAIEYYDKIRDYPKTLLLLDELISRLNNSFFTKEYVNLLIKKAEVLAKNGQYQEALLFYKKGTQAKDSITHSFSNLQMEQILEIYDGNQIKLERERLKDKRNRTILILISISLIFILFVVIRMLFVRNKLKTAEQQMRKAAKIAEEMNEIKNRFLSNLSYSIRTPLNCVVGFSELMADDPAMKENQRKEYATIIQQKSEELMRMVNDVLDLSRLEAGMMKFNIQQYNAITLCREAIFMANCQTSKKINIHFEVQEQILPVVTDISRFTQTLVNLLICPDNYPGEIPVNITFTVSKNKKNVQIRIKGSPLANPNFSSEEMGIKNEINKLFFHQFKGSYQTKTEDGKEIILLTYPLST